MVPFGKETVITIQPYNTFKGERLCVICKNPEYFEIHISAKAFPILPDFKDCKISKDFEQALEKLIKIDYLTCSVAQTMKLVIKNTSCFDAGFEAELFGLRSIP